MTEIPFTRCTTSLYLITAYAVGSFSSNTNFEYFADEEAKAEDNRAWPVQS